jgi:hypothetical protein
VTMSRSLTETGAVVRCLIDAVKEATKEKDVDALDKAVMSAGFATRFEEFMGDDWAYKAKSILTLIDATDRSVFKDNVSRLRKAYDFLSEFVHPNHLGILGLIAITSRKNIASNLEGRVRRKQTFSLIYASRSRWYG